MTNEERFKTMRERLDNFRNWCEKRECDKCEFGADREGTEGCVFSWLAREYKEELKPCPFCGCEQMNTYKSNNTDIWYVSCDRCGVRTEGDTSKEYAIAAWNRRI